MPLSDELRKRLYASLKAPNEALPTPANDTKTSRERKQEFEKRFGYRTPSAELVARIEAAERVVWLPHSYVFFVRQATCRNCRTTVRCLDDARLFLQQRKERGDESNPYLYVPVREIEYRNLPRRKILKLVTVPICEACYEGASCHQTNSMNSGQAVIESPIEGKEASESLLPDSILASMFPSTLLSLQSILQSSSPSNIPPRVSDGSPSETDFGSVCNEREFAETTVTAEG